MALSPGFQLGPPPQATTLTYDSRTNQFVSQPNPAFYVWSQLLWKWTQTLGNNIDGAASFSGSIAIGTSPNWFKADSDGIWLGGATFGASPFSVSMAGAITSTSGSIGGWTINSAYIAKDTGTAATSSGMAPTDYPFYAGSTYANRATAPFRVTPAGVLNASGATISGTIDVASDINVNSGATNYGTINANATYKYFGIKGTASSSSVAKNLYLATGGAYNSISFGGETGDILLSSYPGNLTLTGAAGATMQLGATTAAVTVGDFVVANASTFKVTAASGNVTASGTLTAATFSGAGTSLTGTAASLTAGAATVLATARNIGGTSFNGSASIDPIQTKHAGDGNICSFAGSPGATTYPLVYTVGKAASGGAAPALNRNADDGGTMAWYWYKVYDGTGFIYIPYMA